MKYWSLCFLQMNNMILIFFYIFKYGITGIILYKYAFLFSVLLSCNCKSPFYDVQCWLIQHNRIWCFNNEWLNRKQETIQTVLKHLWFCFFSYSCGILRKVVNYCCVLYINSLPPIYYIVLRLLDAKVNESNDFLQDYM